MPRCDVCGVEVALPFRCRYCGGLFCVEHHLPEKHECPGLEIYKSKVGETGRMFTIPYNLRGEVGDLNYTARSKVRYLADKPRMRKRGAILVLAYFLALIWLLYFLATIRLGVP